MTRRGARSPLWRGLLALALSLCPSFAQAQSGPGGIAVDLFQAAETPEDGFALSRPNDRGHLRFGAQLATDYALSPLVLTDTGAADPPRLVSHLLNLRVGVSLGLIDRIVVFGSLPLIAVLEGEQAPGRVPLADGGGLGDPTLGARVRLIGEPQDVGAVALQLTGSFPLAEGIDASQDLRGDGGPTFQPEVLGEVRFAVVHVTANLGVLFRTAPTFANFEIGHELTWGLGVGAEVIDDLLEARVEGFGRVGLDDPGSAQRNPAELLLGARLYPLEGLTIGAAGGFGIGTGYGTPAFRGVLTVGWAERIDVARRVEGRGWDAADRDDAAARRAAAIDAAQAERDARATAATAGQQGSDGAGVEGAAGEAGAGAADAPPDGEHVARPDYEQLDRDGDRVPDAFDRCPLDREDYDEIQDSDGCPEEDADEDQLADADDRCPLTPGPQRRGECAGCPELACVARDTGQIEITERVEFDSGEATILASSEAVLTDIRAIMVGNDQIRRLRIEGHTDDVGEPDDNLQLSVARAAAVVQWLIAHGVERERMVGFGCGEQHPLRPGSTPRVRARNRRVEFHIVDPPTGTAIREGCQAAP